jgi:hypothetical protein
MSRSIRVRAAWLAALVVFFGRVPLASAQAFTGRIDVTVRDTAGKPVAGAMVTMTGAKEDKQTADASGHARFVDLPVGSYDITGAHSGFASLSSKNLRIAAGSALALVLDLAPAPTVEGAKAVATVTLVPGVVSVTRINASDLQTIPYARDVWALLPTVPTVFVDRVNVGGSESGNQSLLVGNGSGPGDTTWNLDGVPVTNMASRGLSTLFYDTDSLAELAVETGGADVQRATAGVQANVVLKTGANLPHGSTRFGLETDSLQSSNVSNDLSIAFGNTTGKVDRVDSSRDFGAELGGPLFKDQVWIWGSVAKPNIRMFTADGQTDESSFTHYALKADGIWRPEVRGSFAFYQSKKTEDNLGAGPLRGAGAGWGVDDNAKYFKGEGHFIALGKLFATARFARIAATSLLTPVGGLTADTYVDDGGVAHTTTYQSQTTRPQTYVAGDASYTVGMHQLQAGFSLRSTPVDAQITYPGSHVITIWNDYPSMLAQVTRNWSQSTSAQYVAGFLNDTISLSGFTISAGVRLDRQTSSLNASSVPAVAGFETVLPAATAAAQSNVYLWTNVTPRLGIAWRMGGTRVRASYALLPSQLSGTQAGFASSIQNAFVTYKAVDQNADNIAQPSEFVGTTPVAYGGIDLAHPTSTTSVNRVGSTTAPRTYEFVVGGEQDVMRDVAVSAAVTYRNIQNLLWSPLIGVRQAQYVSAGTVSDTLPEIGTFSAPVYALPAASVPAGAGLESVNRDGYHQRAVGFELDATKRLSHRWMAGVRLAANKWTEYFDNPATSIVDPTQTPGASSTPYGGPQVSGGPVTTVSAGGGAGDVYLTPPSLQVAVNGMIRGPFGVDVAAHFTARPGYPEPFFQSLVATSDALGPKTVLLTKNVDDFRLPTVRSLDGRAERAWVFAGIHIAVDVDVFNLLNADTVLAKQYDARLTGATGFDQVLQIMNPRVLRITAKLFF